MSPNEPWHPSWQVPSVPCAHPETCGAQQPICLPCIAGKKAFKAENPDGSWSGLQEWIRGVWRAEAADA